MDPKSFNVEDQNNLPSVDNGSPQPSTIPACSQSTEQAEPAENAQRKNTGNKEKEIATWVDTTCVGATAISEEEEILANSFTAEAAADGLQLRQLLIV